MHGNFFSDNSKSNDCVIYDYNSLFGLTTFREIPHFCSKILDFSIGLRHERVNKLYTSITFLNKPYPLIQLKAFLHWFVDIVWIYVAVNCFETTLLEWIRSLHLNPADTGVNSTYIRLSEDLLDAFWTSYVRSIYVLCLRANIFYYCSIAPERFLKSFGSLWWQSKLFGICRCFKRLIFYPIC